MTAAAPARKTFRRLAPDDRRRQIVDAAIAYFADVGFDGTTRGLAERLRITQPLIYRYFPSKEDLIQAVYEDVYLGRWRGEWVGLLAERDKPLRERLIAFYTQFTGAVFEPEWMRLYLFSGLRGLDINRWWITFVEDHVLTRISEEVRHGLGLPGPAERPVSAEEIDGCWLLHGGIFYFGMRQNVYRVAPHVALPRFIEMAVDSFLAGFPQAIEALSRRADERPPESGRRIRRNP